MSIRATSPFTTFLDIDGKPLSLGYVYFGVSGSNPETVPQAVYWDEALTIPAAQPLRTLNGFLVRNGTPSSVYLSAVYSVTVRNKNLVLLYSSLVNVGLPFSTAMIPVVSAATLAVARDALGVSKKIKGYQAISLTHFTDTLEPSVTAGSEIEVDGTFYEFPIDEAAVAGGWAAIAVSTVVYMYLVPAGAAHTWIYSATAPTWDTDKQGWYNGANRAFGGLYKDAGGNYTLKWLYDPNDATGQLQKHGSGKTGAISSDSTIHADGAIDSDTTISSDGILTGGGGVVAGTGNATLLKKVLNIGDWNMDSTLNVSVAHGLTASKIRSVKVLIVSDVDFGPYTYPLEGQIVTSGAKYDGGSWQINGANIVLERYAAGLFDGVNWNATSYNRGTIAIEYTP